MQQLTTGGHKTFGVKFLFEHTATHQLLLSVDTNAASNSQRFIPPNRYTAFAGNKDSLTKGVLMTTTKFHIRSPLIGILALVSLLNLLRCGSTKLFVSNTLPSTMQQNIKTGASSEPGPLHFSEIVQVHEASKDQLYSAALAWFGHTYRSGKDVLQTQDREGGTIIGRALFRYEPVIFMGSDGIRGVDRYTITIELKDGRYRYTLADFTHEGNPANPMATPKEPLFPTLYC